MLWFWILGLTDHFIQGHVNLENYEKKAEKLYQEVSRLNLHFKQSQHFHLQLSRNGTQEMEISTEREPIGSITSNTVANFFMLRSWNLLESMKYSESVIPKVTRRLTKDPIDETVKGGKTEVYCLEIGCSFARISTEVRVYGSEVQAGFERQRGQVDRG